MRRYRNTPSFLATNNNNVLYLTPTPSNHMIYHCSSHIKYQYSYSRGQLSTGTMPSLNSMHY